MIELFARPGFIVGRNPNDMVDEVWDSINHKIHHNLVVQKCEEVWHASRTSYPAVESDSILIEIIQSYCEEIRCFNTEKKNIKKRMIKLAKKNRNLML
jgi:transposase